MTWDNIHTIALDSRRNSNKALSIAVMATLPRRALTNVGGKVLVEFGNARDQDLLKRALDVRADDPYLMSHVHGFHAYPARLHPITARRLVAGLTRPGDCVLDPFCGSGTVPVEALLQARVAWGLDANPLSAMLASYKLKRTTALERGRLLASAKMVTEAAEARRIAHAGATRRYPANQASQFDPHVLLELDGLQSSIKKLQDAQCQTGLLLVLSAIANKVSRQTSDTAARPNQRRWASGYVIKFFYKKTEELVRRLVEFSRAAASRHQASIGYQTRRRPEAAVSQQRRRGHYLLTAIPRHLRLRRAPPAALAVVGTKHQLPARARDWRKTSGSWP